MAHISRVDMKPDKVIVTLEVAPQEFKALDSRSRSVLLISADMMDETLTTGAIGNSNHIMLPNKMLKRYNIEQLIKKAPSKICTTLRGKFLVIELEHSDLGVPVFSEGPR